MRPSLACSLRIRSFVSPVTPPAVSSSAAIQKPIEAAYYRGGTSRAVIIQPHCLPPQRAKWPSIFRQIMGSGDPYGRQLDGMGAGISSLSKICLVEPYGKRIVKPGRGIRFRTGYGGIDAARASAEATKALEEAQQSGDEQKLDIDYTFVGLGIESDELDVAGNCGNMSAAIGPYAYNAGILPPRFYGLRDGKVTVKIRNTNTGKLIDSTFNVVGGEASVLGHYSIDGVTGVGSMVKLDFKDPYGSKTGKVLPTGNTVNRIAGYRVTCVDGANPAVFIRADDIGVDGTILPSDFNKLPEKLTLLENIRKAAAVVMGLASTENLVPRTIPKIGVVSQSSTHPVLSGQMLKTAQTDLVIRFLSDTQPHRAIPLTAALTTAVAARIPGTIVEQLLAPDPVVEGAITIGHASGRLQVDATMNEKNQIRPTSATVYRTAKRLFEGNVYWSDKGEEEVDTNATYASNGRHSLGLAFVMESRGQETSHLFRRDAQESYQKQELVPRQEQKEEQGTERSEEYHDFKSRPPSSYRALPDPHHKRAPQARPHYAETPLSNALERLQDHITDILSDPDLATRPYPVTLQTTVVNAYQRIVNSSHARHQTDKGKEWHRFARSLAIRKKSLRASVERAEKLEAKVAMGFKRTTRREVGLDRDGIGFWEDSPTKRAARWKNRRVSFDDVESRRDEKKCGDAFDREEKF